MKIRYTRVFATLGAVAVATAALVGCSATPSETSGDDPSAVDASWPRTIEHELGTTVIEAKPENIVSTSPSITGTLLAIDAPITATAGAAPNGFTADEDGFFMQWADVANDRGVTTLYPNLEYDLEAVIAADPDLVIISTTGADAVTDYYDELSELFPTIAINYSDKTWQDLATILGEAAGLETEAEAVTGEFDDFLADAASRITAPQGGVSIVSYNGAGAESAVGMTTGAHGQMFEELGIEVIPADPQYDTGDRVRQDFAFVAFENLSAAITGESIFLIAAEDDKVDQLLAEPTLANLTAVKEKQVYALGAATFRIDYYSATQIADTLVDILG